MPTVIDELPRSHTSFRSCTTSVIYKQSAATMFRESTKTPRRWVDPVVICGAVGAAILLIGRLADPFGLPLDDSWIHQVIARNFAEHGVLGFDPRQFASAATSLSWPVLLSVFFMAGGTSPAPFALVVNLLLHIGTALVIWRMLGGAGTTRLNALLLSLAFSLAANYVWFVLSGMEATLVVFLSCAAIHAWTASRNVSSAVLAAVACVALVFTRVETALLPALLVMYDLMARRLEVRRTAAFLAVVGTGIAILVGLNLALTGSPLPSTLAGRRWMWLLSFEGATAIDLAVRLAMRWVDRLGAFTLGTDSVWVAWLAVGIAAHGAVSLWRSRAPGLQLLLAWACTHLVIYAVLLPVEGHGGRYQPLVAPIFSLALCVGLMNFLRAAAVHLGSRTSNLDAAGPIGAIGLLLALLACNAEWGYYHSRAIEHIDLTEVRMGRTVASLPPDATVASFDIGAIGFYGRRQLIDLGALSDPGVLKHLQDGTVMSMLDSRGATYVVIPQWYLDDAPDPGNFLMILRLHQFVGTRLHAVADVETPSDTWLPGLRATMHSAPRQVLYRLEKLPP